MIWLALYFWWLTVQPAPPTTYISTAVIKPVSWTIAVVALVPVPDGDDWLVLAGNDTWSGQGRVTCEGSPGIYRPRKITVERTGHPRLIITLECPEEKKP